MVSRKLFGVDGRRFFDAIDEAGSPFPFSDQSTTGIMWTGMKDSRPAPDGYIKSLIHKWRADSLWESNKGLIVGAARRIHSGIDKLNRFAPQVNTGVNTVYEWSVGANFQLWQAVIARAIVQRAEGRGYGNEDEWTRQITRLKRAYTGWAEEWMTPRSALQSSGLIYDAILDFFRE
jgi:hypothetical protein